MALENPNSFIGITSMTGHVTASGTGAVTSTIPGGTITPAMLATGYAAVGTGTSFPGSPSTNDIFFRTDRATMYYYDGTRWLSVQEYAAPMQAYNTFGGVNGISASTTRLYFGTPPMPNNETTIYITKWSVVWWVSTTNSGGNNWTIKLSDALLNLVDSFSTDGLGIDSYINQKEDLGSVRTLATDDWYSIDGTKNASPGNLFLYNPYIYFRLIG